MRPRTANKGSKADQSVSPPGLNLEGVVIITRSDSALSRRSIVSLMAVLPLTSIAVPKSIKALEPTDEGISWHPDDVDWGEVVNDLIRANTEEAATGIPSNLEIIEGSPHWLLKCLIERQFGPGLPGISDNASGDQQQV